MSLTLTSALAPALALLPDFALILLGGGLRRVLHLGDHFWSGLEKLIYFVLFPALLFNGLVRTRIDWSAAGPLLAVTMGAMGTGIVLGYGARLFRLTPMSFASQYQCAFRFNSYIGLAVAGKLLAVKLIAMPLAARGLIRWFGLTGVYAGVALVFAALPTASSAYILAQRMGGDGARVAWLISVGTLLGMLTLPFWLAFR